MALLDKIKPLISEEQHKLPKEVKAQLISEMNTIRAEEGFLDGRVKGFIDRDKQMSYTMELFKNQANQEKESLKQRYAKNINSWLTSAISRSRLVVIEADHNTIKEIASATFNASPIDRVVIAGLDESKAQSLKNELRKLWKERLIASPENYKQLLLNNISDADRDKMVAELLVEKNKDSPPGESIEDSLQGQSPEEFLVAQKSIAELSGGQNLDDWLENLSLNELLGPHLQKNNLDLCFESLKEEFPHFDVNIEEVLCIGTSNELVQTLGDLGRKSNKGHGVPVFSVKSEAIQKGDDHSLWKCFCTNSKEFITSITSGKSATELIVLEDKEGAKNISLAPTYEELFALGTMQKEMNSQGFNEIPLEQKDLDYFKTILFNEALYCDNTSPDAITKTISKATSKLGAVKALTVARSLWLNMVKMPVSSGVEVDFAIGSMTLDGGNDLAKENLDKKNCYKLFYEDLLDTLVKQGVDDKTAIKTAFAQTLNAYVSNEKQDETIKELINSSTGGEAWRDFGLHATNKVKNVNKKGLRILILSPFLFVGGLALFIIPGGAVALGSAAIAILAVSTVVAAASMYFQIRANKKYLPRANSALAEANKKMCDAHNTRIKLQAKRLTEIKQKIKNNDFEGLRALNASHQPKPNIENTQAQTKDNSRRKLFPFLYRKRNIPLEVKRHMIDKLKAINEANNIDIKGELPHGSITREMKIEYTMGLFMNQANIAKLSSQEDYAKNLNAWMESGPSRPRMVALEASDDEKELKELAQVTFNASPLECVVVAGLDANKQKIFKKHLETLWKEKLENSPAKKEQFEKIHRRGSNEGESIDKLIKNCSLDYLMGPHHFKEDLDLSYDSMQNRFPHFDVNIEEVLCYGSSPELAENLGALGQRIQKGVPVFSVKSTSFQEGEDDHGLWKCSCDNPEDFMKGITLGKSAPELIGSNSRGRYENITISPAYQAMFKLSSFHEEMSASEYSKSSGDSETASIKQEDLDYFKKILFHEALYPANTSPERITQTISKATSKLGAMAGIDVANALIQNLYGNPKSTIVEIAYAISFMALDGGNDLVKENLDIKNIYKNFFEDLRDWLLKGGQKPEDATKLAFIKTILTYNAIEKSNISIYKNVSGVSGANNWRDLGLENANKARAITRKGTMALRVIKYLFAASVVVGIAGLTVASLGTALPIIGAAVLGYAGFATAVASSLALAYSTQKIVKANKKYLPIANFAFQQANSRMFDAQKDRNTAIAKRLEEIKKDYIQDNDQNIGQELFYLAPRAKIKEETKREIAKSDPILATERAKILSFEFSEFGDFSKKIQNSPLFTPEARDFILKGAIDAPYDEYTANMKELLIDYYLQPYDKIAQERVKADLKFQELKTNPAMSLEGFIFLSVVYAEGRQDMKKLISKLNLEEFSTRTPEVIKTLLVSKQGQRESTFTKIGKASREQKNKNEEFAKFEEQDEAPKVNRSRRLLYQNKPTPPVTSTPLTPNAYTSSISTTPLNQNASTNNPLSTSELRKNVLNAKKNNRRSLRS